MRKGHQTSIMASERTTSTWEFNHGMKTKEIQSSLEIVLANHNTAKTQLDESNSLSGNCLREKQTINPQHTYIADWSHWNIEVINFNHVFKIV